MRLSEAIRAGAKLRPQAFDTLFSIRQGASCALGAACEAIGILDLTRDNAYTKDAQTVAKAHGWFWAHERTVRACPECGAYWFSSYGRRNVYGAIVHLNNEHKWTRERIATWIAKREPRKAAK